jgi:hypothetical protein
MISSGGPLQWVDLLLQSGSRKEEEKVRDFVLLLVDDLEGKK